MVASILNRNHNADGNIGLKGYSMVIFYGSSKYSQAAVFRTPIGMNGKSCASVATSPYFAVGKESATTPKVG